MAETMDGNASTHIGAGAASAASVATATATTAAASAAPKPSLDASDDDDGYENDREVRLDDIERSKTINFNIDAKYTNWEPREAFRELVQNWRDGIIKSFKLAERDFCVVREERTRGRDLEIVFKVPHPRKDKRTWIGYILFKALDGEGTIEITNRGATLQPRHLVMGASSKKGDSQQAGAHGEGLKLALLVLMRSPHNHTVRCRTGDFNWIFNFTTSGLLVARLTRMSHERIQREEDEARRLRERNEVPFAAKANRDVQFLIGEPRRGRHQWGGLVKRVPVTRQEFEAWTKAVLFLQDAQDGAIIPTGAGDLLTSESLRGKIYLKGLLLAESTGSHEASISGRPLKFGYNFASGKTNRERQSVTNADDEGRTILNIWSKVLEIKQDMVHELSTMLNTAKPQYADVARANLYLNRATAMRLRDYLVGEQFAGKWYYCSEDKDQGSRLNQILEGLGCEGVCLTKQYWDILRAHKLVRTAQEEEHRRFLAAQPNPAAQEKAGGFAVSVCRLLRACLRACSKTNGMRVGFVQAGQLHLHLVFSKDERLFRVHERWLRRDEAIKELNLAEDVIEEDVVFHAVKLLFGNALEQLPREAFLDESDDARTPEWRKRLESIGAEQRLINHQRLGKLEFDPRWADGGCTVQWAVDTRLAFGDVIELQCHVTSRCAHLEGSLLVAEDADSDKLPCFFWNRNDAETRKPCVFYRFEKRYGSYCVNFGDHPEDLMAGESYFFVLLTPKDPASLCHNIRRRKNTGELGSTRFPVAGFQWCQRGR